VDGNISVLIDEAPFVTHFDRSQTLEETGGAVVFGMNGEFPLLIDEAPLIAHAHAGHSFRKVTLTKFRMLHQDPTPARHAVELGPGKVVSIAANEAPFSSYIHSGKSAGEQTRLVELRIDDNLAVLIDVAPTAGDAYRRKI